MTFHTDLINSGGADFLGDIETALSTSSGSAYYGRRARKTPATGELEVWVERLEAEPEHMNVGRARLHGYNLHVRRRLNQGPDQTGADLLDAVETGMRTLADRYDGAGLDTFIASLTDLVAIQATEDEVDTITDDEDGDQVMEGVVRITFLVRR